MNVFVGIRYVIKENYIYYLACRGPMATESIRLDGLVLHSQGSRLELSRQFYQTLLNVQFRVERHHGSPQHYFYQLGKTFLELYPSPEKMLSSFALRFSTSGLEAIQQRMKGHIFRPKTVHDTKTITYADPEERNIRLHSADDIGVAINLDEIALHTRHPSEARSFYQQLLETPFTEQSYGAGQVPFYSGKNNDITLKLWPDNVNVAPSPSLFFACSDLSKARARMYNYSKSWKQFNDREARILDLDQRKIILYQE